MFSLRIVAGLLFVGQIVVVGTLAAAEPEAMTDARAKQFIERYEAQVRPLEIDVNRLWWTAFPSQLPQSRAASRLTSPSHAG